MSSAPLSDADRARLAATVADYDRDAATLADRYEAVPVARRLALHEGFLPTAGAWALDVGAGSGGVAAALADRGCKVVAVEPSAGMRGEAMRRHADAAVEWRDDRLPDLAGVTAPRGGFAFVLVGAVWMHLPSAVRPAAMARLAGLLAPGGILALSIRHGPAPEGRSMYRIDPAEVIAAATAAGLVLERRTERPDRSRPEVTWTWLHLRKAESG